MWVTCVRPYPIVSHGSRWVGRCVCGGGGEGESGLSCVLSNISNSRKHPGFQMPLASLTYQV